MTTFEKRIIWLSLLNFWDLFATYYFVVFKKMAEEYNPAMDFLIQLNPVYFIAYKILTMFAIVVLADYSTKSKNGLLIYRILLSFYVAVSTIHVVNFLF